MLQRCVMDGSRRNAQGGKHQKHTESNEQIEIISGGSDWTQNHRPTAELLLEPEMT